MRSWLQRVRKSGRVEYEELLTEAAHALEDGDANRAWALLEEAEEYAPGGAPPGGVAVPERARLATPWGTERWTTDEVDEKARS